ncbi:hypothetical protein HRbin29_00823 [bacterium HR29]|jgi:hypothetical protein|nr:hypothetical protein HRbin29_00823 [bacterium HR29]
MPRVDRNALRFNQACIVAGVVAAFVLGDGPGRWLILAVAAVMLAGTAWEPLSLFKQVYRHGAVRLGLLRPRPVDEDPTPHRFAQGLGGTFLLGSFLALLLSAPLVGWALAWLVVALALVNLLFGFCAGCFLYFQLERAGLLPRSAEAR